MKTYKTSLFKLWVITSVIWMLCCSTCMLYHFIEERDFAEKAEFNIKWNNALPNGGWLSKDATLESETLRYERKWNYFMVLMAVLTFTCPLVILILGKIVLRINLFGLDDNLQRNFAQGMKLTIGKELPNNFPHIVNRGSREHPILPSSMPSDLQMVVRKMLDPNRDHRYQTAGEAHDAFVVALRATT